MLELLLRGDAAIAQGLNAWAAGAPRLAPLLAWVAGADALKTLPFILLMLAAWHRPPLPRHRLVVLMGMLGALAALALGRTLPALLPQRNRPLHNPQLGLLPVPGVSPGALDGWTSFPSDHGLLFAALVGLAFALHRRLGWAMLGFASLVIWLPRVVLGYHYATDIVVGVLLGLGLAALAQQPLAGRLLGQPLLARAQRHPALFHCLAFLLLAQLAAMFTPLRTTLGLLRHALQG